MSLPQTGPELAAMPSHDVPAKSQALEIKASPVIDHHDLSQEMPECKITLKFECRRRWEELPESQEPHRFCDQCEQNVYWADNYDEASEHAEAGHCIAYQLPLGMIIMGPCLLYTSPSPRDKRQSRMPSSA